MGAVSGGVEECPRELLDLVVPAVVEFYTVAAVTPVQTVPLRVLSADAKPAELFTASLGFSGEHIRGAIVVTTSTTVLRLSNPQRDFKTTFDDADDADWIGETANQIVGNLKRRIARAGVSCTLGTPTGDERVARSICIARGTSTTL